jgi:hypothetical protein
VPQLQVLDWLPFSDNKASRVICALEGTSAVAEPVIDQQG